jgi:hypothetical protein
MNDYNGVLIPAGLVIVCLGIICYCCSKFKVCKKSKPASTDVSTNVHPAEYELVPTRREIEMDSTSDDAFFLPEHRRMAPLTHSSSDSQSMDHRSFISRLDSRGPGRMPNTYTSTPHPDPVVASTPENNPPLPTDVRDLLYDIFRLADNDNDRLLHAIVHPAPSSGSGANASNTRDVNTPTLSQSSSGVHWDTNITARIERQQPTAPPSEPMTSPYPVHDAHLPPPLYESLNVHNEDDDTPPPSYTDCVTNPSHYTY